MTWRELEKSEGNVWAKFNELYRFHPSSGMNNEIIPKEASTPYREYRVKVNMIAYMFNENEDLTPTYTAAEKQVREAFKEIFGDFAYALDWQHTCYEFDPNEAYLQNEFGEWLVPFFPDGDYHFFLDKSMQAGWLGHPWRRTVTIIGARAINIVEEKQFDFLEYGV
ncbi:DUF2716 domain-containing protein [Listeria booriae]|uniref:DUF2716 domain-containing protein n=1 Tax=Listeria booriae TaxID=1552123 RepID=UPI00162552CF|nr:DUF2716 domain-containing protein [Listeria booriae]MBC1334870.1 DUF2716 domain-containing protein [Listeria booriae]MBC6128539.1 DUF2716 domain-containing protein [Listeria booriae]